MIIGLNFLIFVVMIVGLLIYLLTDHPEKGKVAEVGKIMFAIGLFCLLFNGAEIIKLLSK